jgi:hypothetical protein
MSWRGWSLELENVELILFRLPPCRSHPLDPTNTRRLFYRVGRHCTRHCKRMSRSASLDHRYICVEKRKRHERLVNVFFFDLMEGTIGSLRGSQTYAERRIHLPNESQRKGRFDPENQMRVPKFFDWVGDETSDRFVPK